MGANAFEKPGFMVVVWIVCLLIVLGAWQKVDLPLWLVIPAFFGTMAPIARLIFGG